MCRVGLKEHNIADVLGSLRPKQPYSTLEKQIQVENILRGVIKECFCIPPQEEGTWRVNGEKVNQNKK